MKIQDVQQPQSEDNNVCCKLAVIATVDAGRFIRRLCKHFTHRVPASWDDKKGLIEFAMGRCILQATDDSLSLRCEAANDDDLLEIMQTMKSHFERFAEKDQLCLRWS